MGQNEADVMLIEMENTIYYEKKFFPYSIKIVWKFMIHN